MATDPKLETERTWTQAAFRLGVALFLVAVGLLIWLSNLYFTERFSQATRNDAETQVALYTGRLVSELQRNSVVPLLLSRDTTLISALNSRDFTGTSQRLISYQEEIGAKSIVLLDETGRVIAASDRRELGAVIRENPYFIAALRSSDTVFTTAGLEEGPIGFFYSRKMLSQKETIGVIIVEVDLDNLFDTWSGRDSTIFVTNSKGTIILSTERQFQHLTIEEALTSQPALSPVERAWRATGEWTQSVVDAYIKGQPLFRLESKVPFQGWRLSYLASFEGVRARVNGVLALELMALAILTALGFYILSRRAIRQSFLFKAESVQLRALNERLSSEIAERERVEKHLEVAEQSLAQSSKLAALGEMSAAVSHELNQPLAAMRTYLAGAKLLLQRQRPEEALSSFQRIDDLIGRMGAITRQLKSYARKGGEDLVAVDMRDAVSASMSMMAPQLSQMKVEIAVNLPSEPVMVMGDRVRLEQVIVNLLRNALDAMKLQEDRKMDILLVSGEMAKLSVRDNGTGIENLDEMFEPFFTTKKPGDGVGLGLAISSGIAKDLGGRLLARNAKPSGAVFEFHLPSTDKAEVKAAE
ncbi:MAG: sensor histidine kinase [Rhodobacteraceae bacterium]|nr:sensor histidine kinase [Paracoccaceae bacterium]